jgi:hypothetical protein
LNIGNDHGIIKKIIRLLNIANNGHIARYFKVTNFFCCKTFFRVKKYRRNRSRSRIGKMTRGLGWFFVGMLSNDRWKQMF